MIAGAASLWLAPVWSTQASRGDINAVLGDIFTDPAAAGAIGAVYLKQTPGSAALSHARRLKAQFAGRSDGQKLRGRLRHQIEADFATGRVVSVDGWILSQTEAVLCALVAQQTHMA